MSAQPERISPASLPAEFDAAIYRRRHAELRGLGDAELLQHFRGAGTQQGHNASSISARADFLALISPAWSVLEIGPFANPLMRGGNVRYFDVLSTDELRDRARRVGFNPQNCPDIDFVSPNGDLDVVAQQFDIVTSCHSVEHQPDLIRHLQSVSRVLSNDGMYFLVVPDKRYCFDHFLAESNLAEVLAAHLCEARVHSAQNVIEHLALTTHNDPLRHWAGDHGAPAYRANPDLLRGAIESFAGSAGRYIDVHAWKFTPASFAELLRALFDLQLIALKLLRVYPTAPGSCEFFAILQNTAQHVGVLRGGAPADFDDQQYLLANPDVAAAGVDALQHYCSFGRREGRKLKA